MPPVQKDTWRCHICQKLDVTRKTSDPGPYCRDCGHEMCIKCKKPMDGTSTN